MSGLSANMDGKKLNENARKSWVDQIDEEVEGKATLQTSAASEREVSYVSQLKERPKEKSNFEANTSISTDHVEQVEEDEVEGSDGTDSFHTVSSYLSGNSIYDTASSSPDKGDPGFGRRTKHFLVSSLTQYCC